MDVSRTQLIIYSIQFQEHSTYRKYFLAQPCPHAILKPALMNAYHFALVNMPATHIRAIASLDEDLTTATFVKHCIVQELHEAFEIGRLDVSIFHGKCTKCLVLSGTSVVSEEQSCFGVSNGVSNEIPRRTGVTLGCRLAAVECHGVLCVRLHCLGW